ncbi:DUF4346 domain-containing protein [Candidatus Woesearchaeota archaeon]|nr:DUF4346 domain-containing protein [Candidatus Woesearchaeota archaeon]
MKWPLIFNDLILLGNPNSQVCVLTLWTKKEEVAKYLNPLKYALIGQLYSKDEGVSALLRNCLANKNIRHLIVTGNDVSGSGKALVDFFKKGIDNRNKIVDHDVVIDKEIPKKSLELLRKNVQCHDYRTLREYAKLNSVIDHFQKLSSYGKPELFPSAQLKTPEIYPHEQVGFCIHEKNIHHAWARVLQFLLRFGVLEKQRALFDLMIVVAEENPEWQSIYPFSEKMLESYFVNIKNKITFILKKVKKNRCDTFDQLPRQMLILRALQKNIAQELKLQLGNLCLFIQKAILQKKDVGKTRNVLSSTQLPFKRIGDLRGNIAICLDRGHIRVTHLDPAGKRLEVFYGMTAFELYKKIILEERISELGHAAYLGAELTKAEIALKKGLKYVQDEQVDW